MDFKEGAFVRRLVLVSGTASIPLSEKIAENLGMNLVESQVRKFANGELCCQISQNVRGADVFVVQSISSPNVNDNLMELLIIIDALKRASAESIIAVIPLYGYARQDRKVNPRTPISSKLVADLLTVAGATRIITVDVHSGQIQGFFNIPFDNIYAEPVLLDYLKSQNWGDDLICVSPDSGGVERVRRYAKNLGCDLAMIDKRRVAPNVAKAMNIVGDVRDKNVIIIDDIIDTAGTLIEAVKTLKNHGAKKIYSSATHGIFSDPAYERLSNCDDLTGIIITDTVEMNSNFKNLEKLKVISIAEILGKAIHYTFNDDSLSSLFI